MEKLMDRNAAYHVLGEETLAKDEDASAREMLTRLFDMVYILMVLYVHQVMHKSW